MTTPQQVNGYDCGVYLAAIAELVAAYARPARRSSHHSDHDDLDGHASRQADDAGGETLATAVRALTPSGVAAKRAEWLGLITDALEG